jgi:hypothetical protein
MAALKRQEEKERTPAMRNNMFEDLPYDDPPAIERHPPIIAGVWRTSQQHDLNKMCEQATMYLLI